MGKSYIVRTKCCDYSCELEDFINEFIKYNRDYRLHSVQFIPSLPSYTTRLEYTLIFEKVEVS